MTTTTTCPRRLLLAKTVCRPFRVFRARAALRALQVERHLESKCAVISDARHQRQKSRSKCPACRAFSSPQLCSRRQRVSKHLQVLHKSEVMDVRPLLGTTLLQVPSEVEAAPLVVALAAARVAAVLAAALGPNVGIYLLRRWVSIVMVARWSPPTRAMERLLLQIWVRAGRPVLRDLCKEVRILILVKM